MTSEVEERPRLVTGGYGPQWVKRILNYENVEKSASVAMSWKVASLKKIPSLCQKVESITVKWRETK